MASAGSASSEYKYCGFLTACASCVIKGFGSCLPNSKKFWH